MEWYDPFDEVRKLQRQINRFLESVGSFPVAKDATISEKQFAFREPLADVQDKDNEIVVSLDLPGANKDDIELNVTENKVTVRVERKKHAVEKRKDFYRAERSYKGFYRSLRLPEKIIPEKATANYKNGVLEIRLPKSGKVRKARKIEIK